MTREDRIQRFLHSPQIYFATRQSIGIVLPVLLILFMGDKPSLAITVASGALGVSLADQQDSVQKDRYLELLVTSALNFLVVFVSNVASVYPLSYFLVVTGTIFFLSMFSAWGKRGGFVAFGVSLTMLINLVSDFQPEQALIQSTWVLAGSLFYLVYCVLMSWIFRTTEERQSLAHALFVTARYVHARSQFYDASIPIDDCYRQMRKSLTQMADAQQEARNLVIQAVPQEHSQPGSLTRSQQQQVKHWNVFLQMVQLLDTLVASRTDFVQMRETFGQADMMLFMRDMLVKMSYKLETIALALSRNKRIMGRDTVTPELRAIEYEIVKLREQGLDKENPEVFALCLKVLRRFREANNTIEHMAENLRVDPATLTVNASVKRDQTLVQFQNRNQYRWGRLWANMTMRSPIFRYALRQTVAIMMVEGLSFLFMQLHNLSRYNEHGYWIIMTVLLIMRPGFALTRQRTLQRLWGTLLGCVVVLIFFMLFSNNYLYFAVLLFSMIVGLAFVSINYFVGAFFITIYVLTGFHFFDPGDLTIIGERAIDTIVACAIAYSCTFLFPWWERGSILPMAKSTIDANLAFFRETMGYVHSVAGNPPDAATRAHNPAYVKSQNARRNMLNRYGAFADSYGRMLGEPKDKQIFIEPLNTLLTHSEALAGLTRSITPDLAALPVIPEKIQAGLDYVDAALDLSQVDVPEAPVLLENDPALGEVRFMLRRMMASAQELRENAITVGLVAAPSLALKRSS